LAARYGVKQKIARLRNPGFFENPPRFTLAGWGVDLAIQPELETAKEIVHLIKRSAATDVREFAGSRVQFTGIRIDGRSVPPAVIINIFGFMFLDFGLLMISTLAMTLMGLDLVTALSSVAASIGNIGPGLGAVGPAAKLSLQPASGSWRSACWPDGLKFTRCSFSSPAISGNEPTAPHRLLRGCRPCPFPAGAFVFPFFGRDNGTDISAGSPDENGGN
jgi:hypothetical protein